MSNNRKKALPPSAEPLPKTSDIGRREKRRPEQLTLDRTMRQVAIDLKRRFPLQISQEPRQFKKKAVYYLKCYLPPGPGRPAEEAVTKAIELRKQGQDWKQIYPQCICNHSQLLPAARRVAEGNLRAARRARGNAARRRKRQRKSTAGRNTRPECSA